jgi:hypothetical protein
MKRNASQLAGALGAVCGKGLLRKRIELAGGAIPLNVGVELRRIEGFEPRAKPRQLAQGQAFERFLDVFSGGHV